MICVAVYFINIHVYIYIYTIFYIFHVDTYFFIIEYIVCIVSWRLLVTLRAQAWSLSCGTRFSNDHQPIRGLEKGVKSRQINRICIEFVLSIINYCREPSQCSFVFFERLSETSHFLVPNNHVVRSIKVPFDQGGSRRLMNIQKRDSRRKTHTNADSPVWRFRRH